jgi:hypothetical protein
MFMPIFIFLMIFSPVIIPAVITAVHAIKRTNQPSYLAGHPQALASRGFAVPSAA